MNLRGVRIPRPVSAILFLLLLGGLFYWKARQDYLLNGYINTNFFSFWLSGHMVWTGQSPYDPAQWKAGFDAVNATYRPSQILQYPLPLMYFMAPIGRLPVGPAYFVWVIVTQIIIALVIFALLRLGRARSWLVLPVMAFMLFFGPVYLTLHIGAIGAIPLLAIASAILLLESDRPLLAGIALSVTFLKPPQALTLVALAVIWFLIRRKWKAIAGLFVGGLGLLVIWMLRDPLWLTKFRGSSSFLLGHTLGVQSNVFGFAYLACARNESCMYVSGIAAGLAALSLGAYLLWRNREAWTEWQAFNVILPLGFVTALYLYSYDQLLYVLPIVWIVVRLLRGRRPYVAAFGFLVVVDLVSLAALTYEAYTHLDLTSLATTLLILGMCLWLSRGSLTAAARARATIPGSAAPP